MEPSKRKIEQWGLGKRLEASLELRLLMTCRQIPPPRGVSADGAGLNRGARRSRPTELRAARASTTVHVRPEQAYFVAPAPICRARKCTHALSVFENWHLTRIWPQVGPSQ